MRYELRRWINTEQTEYVVRHRSNDAQAIEEQLKRVLTASTEPSMNYIVDTEKDRD